MNKLFNILSGLRLATTEEAFEPHIRKPANEYGDLLFQYDPDFQYVYGQGMQKTNTPKAQKILIDKRQSRFYNLTKLYRLAEKLDGDVVELGCWKGLSTYILNSVMHKHSKCQIHGRFWVVDSFEGLSEPQEQDQKVSEYAPSYIRACSGKGEGSYSSDIDLVKNALAEFDNIQLIKGWIPEVLNKCCSIDKVKFIHIDLDLYTPIKESFDYFYDKMCFGAVVVFDDYGSLYWPGAKQAVDELEARYGGILVPLSSGQAFWIKN